MARMTINYLDRVWYSAESKRVVGDMAFTFCERGDTKVLAADAEDTIIFNIEEFIDSDDAVENGEVGDGRNTDFAIYELYTAEVETEDEDEDDIYMADEVEGTSKVIKVFVCATEEDAKDIITARYGKDMDATYRIEE